MPYATVSTMKTTTISRMTATLLILLAFAIAGCAEDTPSSIPASSAYKDKIAALEAEIASIKEQAMAREEAMKQELAALRANFDHIQGLLQAEKERTQTQPPVTPEDGQPGSQPDENIEEKAKQFFNENLDKLVDGTKKLLDQMEKEIDEQMKKLTPAPKGEEI